MKRLNLPVIVVFSLLLSACGPTPTPTPDVTATDTAVAQSATLTAQAPTETSIQAPTSTPTHTPAPTPTTVPTRTPTPTVLPAAGGQRPEPPPPEGGYAFEFSRNYSGDATIKGKAHTCDGVRGPWSLEVVVSGSPEAGATIETTGAVVFTVPEDDNRTEVRIPTTGTGTFDYGDGVGEGTIDDPLLFIFTLMLDEESAEITVTSTGEGTVVLHLPDAPDVTVLFGTVFATDPTFMVSLRKYDGCK
jgi:hypothetical protein